jgi:Voltage-dependent anion channel
MMRRPRSTSSTSGSPSKLRRTAILAGLAAVVWFVLTYGVPASLLARERDSVLGGVNGTWLLWVVSTQSLSVAASALVPAWPSQSGLLAPADGCCKPGHPRARLLDSYGRHGDHRPGRCPDPGPPAALPVTRATAGFVEGFSFALWAFGTWWIPLLILLGLRRYVRRRWPLSYEPALWSAVFPLGMYSVATLSFGKVARLGFMEPLGRFMLWVAVAAWVVVAVAALSRLNQRSPVTRLPGYPGRSRSRAAPMVQWFIVVALPHANCENTHRRLTIEATITRAQATVPGRHRRPDARALSGSGTRRPCRRSRPDAARSA